MRFFLLTGLAAVPVCLILFLVLGRGLGLAWPQRDRIAAELAGAAPRRHLLLRIFVRPRPDPLPVLAAALLVALVLGLGVDALHPDDPGNPLLSGLDRTISAWAQAGRSATLDPVVVALTSFGDAPVLVVATLALATVLGLQKSLRLAIGVGITMVTARLMVTGLKPLVAIPRPSDLYQGVEAFSFPSGHATMTTTWAGILFVLVGAGSPGRRAIRILLAVLVAAMIASRLYLGAHWPSDVTAGFGVGLTFAAAFGFAYGPFTEARDRIDRALLAMLVATLVFGIGRFALHLPAVLGFYAPGA